MVLALPVIVVLLPILLIIECLKKELDPDPLLDRPNELLSFVSGELFKA